MQLTFTKLKGKVKFKSQNFKNARTTAKRK